jgi:hypothetical protein
VALPALLDALDNASDRVTAAAHAALEAIVGRELPDDAVLCRDALGPRG